MAIGKEEVASAAGNSATRLTPKKLSDFENLLVPYAAKVSQIAPKKGMQADRILRMTAATIWMNPKLHECDPRSILMATFQLAMNGLNPSPQFKEAYLIPYGNQCQMQLAYLGMIKLCEKSAMIKAIWGDMVYEGDFYEEVKGTTASIVHREGPNYGDASKFIRAYAVVEKMSGGKQFKSLNKVQIERLRKKNKMQNNAQGQHARGAWETDYDQMALAKALKQVLKTVPMEDEYRSALFIDEQIATGDQFEKFDGVVTPVAEYPVDAPQEGSAEVVPNDPPATEPLSEDQQRQAEFDAQMKKEASLSDLAK